MSNTCILFIRDIIKIGDNMNLDNNKKNYEWYDNPKIIVRLIIAIIVLDIIISQSFSINSDIEGFRMVKDILNHNIIYMFSLVYFILINTKFGKKYFDYLNAIVSLVSLILVITSALTIFQSFGLPSLLSFVLNTLFFIYFTFTFIKGTRYWKEFKIKKTVLNDIKNNSYFVGIVVLELVSFAINLILAKSFNGTVLATFQCLFIILFSRYIYLYGEHVENRLKEEVK